MKYISYPFTIPPKRGNSSDETFLELDNIVQYLFDDGLLTDVECRKIVVTKGIVDVRATIYSIITTKKSTTFKNILQVFRSKTHPLQNPKILKRIFSFLNYRDIKNCKKVCEDWKEVADSVVVSKYDEINLEKFILDKIKREISKTKRKCHHHLYLREKQASVFQLMVSLNPESDEILMTMLQTKKGFQTNIHNTSITESILAPRENLIAKVLSNHTILSNTLEFLSLKDIKSFRVVCRTWNSVAEPFLRKRSIIHFNQSFGPLNFIDVSKYSSLPNLNFTAFKFATHFPFCELTEFFSKFGTIVTSLTMNPIKGIDLCLSYTSNISELHLLERRFPCQADLADSTDLKIPWKKLHAIKILCLSDIIIDADSGYTRIIPLKLHFDNVQFNIGGNRPEEMLLNNFVDFSKAKEVKIEGSSVSQRQIFDWAKDTFNAERISLSDIQFVNAQKSKSSVEYLKLTGHHPLSEKTNMEIKELIFEDGAFKLSAIPPSVEKLTIRANNLTAIDVSQPFQLPNLKYLSFQKGDEFNLISHFDNCPNLTDLEIIGCTDLDIRWLPRSVKRLKVKSNKISYCGQFSPVGPAEDHFDLDLLILYSLSMDRLNDLKFDKIRPKVLVLQFKRSYQDDNFLHFLQRSQRIEKIYVQFKQPIQSSVFKNSQLVHLVDKESAYYEFSNGRGRGITSEEFFKIQSSVDIKRSMLGAWSSDEVEDEDRENQRLEEMLDRFWENMERGYDTDSD